MPPHPPAFTSRPPVVGVLVVVGLALAAAASFTRPFTGGADAVTAVPLAVAAVAVATRRRSAGRAGPVGCAGGPTPPMAPLSRWWLAWGIMAAAVAGWELACYLSAPRRQHPTLSTLIDLLDSSHAGKVVAFALWLLLGCCLVLQ
jgi:hypothetical protein